MCCFFQNWTGSTGSGNKPVLAVTSNRGKVAEVSAPWGLTSPPSRQVKHNLSYSDIPIPVKTVSDW